MDQSLFSSVSVAGIPLVLVIIALVQWLKDFGLQGQSLRLASLLLGLAIGVGYQVSQAVPVDFAAWFGVLIYGLALGLMASRVYDAAQPKTPQQ